jgi:hypothetical protein
MVTSQYARRWNRSNLAWLALAIAIHGVLLLVPLRDWQAPAGLQSAIAIQLVPHGLRNDEPVTPDVQPLEPARQVAARPNLETHQADARPPAPQPAQPDPSVPVPAEPEPSQTTDKPVTMSAARLIDLVSRMSSNARPSPFSRPPGSTPSGIQNLSWRRGSKSAASLPDNNLFDGMVAPAETELVDRWQAADGSNNVVIKTPNGDTLCGRAEAWDPMRPLLEPLMMFRSCGGGGKRTFTMDKRKSS